MKIIDSNCVKIIKNRHIDIVIACYNHRGCWRAGTNDQNQWIQVEFDTPSEITAIQIQGRQNNDHWVKTFELTYSNNGKNWTTYINDDGDTVH